MLGSVFVNMLVACMIVDQSGLWWYVQYIPTTSVLCEFCEFLGSYICMCYSK